MKKWILEKNAVEMAKAEGRAIEFGGHTSNSPYANFEAVLWPPQSNEGKPPRTGETPALYAPTGIEILTGDPATAYKGRVGRGPLFTAQPDPDGLVRVPSNEAEIFIMGVPLGRPKTETFSEIIEVSTGLSAIEGPILNFTQHEATADQVAAGVVNIADKVYQQKLVGLLTFGRLPFRPEIRERAARLVSLAKQIRYGQPFNAIMIGGAPFLMGPLEIEFARNGIRAVYAFSERESVEAIGDDGVVKKTSVFKHRGFI